MANPNLKENIVIAGGGYGGVSCALHLEKLLRSNNLIEKYNIFLIDKSSDHIYTPALYELALAEETKRNVCIPFNEIFKHKKIHFFHSDIKEINKEHRTILLQDTRSLHFKFLVLALGSISNDYGIPGIKEFSLSLKNVMDATTIKEHLTQLLSTRNKKINIVIGGAGFSGTEIAGEILNQRFLRTHEVGKDFNLYLVTGNPLLKEFGESISKEVTQRLTYEGLKIILNEHIESADHNSVKLSSGKILSFDLFIWTGGIKGNPLLMNVFETQKNGTLLVDNYLKVEDEENIYAVGDNATFMDPKTGKPAMWIAETAMQEGRVVASNISNSIKNKPLSKYKYKLIGYIIPVSGRFAYVNLNRIHFKGWFGWVAQQLVLANYLTTILPLPKVIYRWNKFVTSLNDRQYHE